MILRESIGNKWAIENGNGFVLCERYWNSRREAEEWIKIYLSSWSQHLNYTVIPLKVEETPKKKVKKPTINIKEEVKVVASPLELPPIPVMHPEVE